LANTVKLVSLGTSQEIPIAENATVGDVLAFAEVSPDLEVRVNGQSVENSAPVAAGDTVVGNSPAVKHGI